MKNKINIIVAICLILSILACKKPKAKDTNNTNNNTTDQEIRKGDFYVSPTGNDNNSGSEDMPFATIKKGVEALSDGETLIVKSGVYDEFVYVEKGGEKKSINILAETINKTQCSGFRIFKKADNVKINGFKIVETNPENSGIVVYGKSNIEISDCHISECSSGAIRIFKNAKNIIIKNNTMVHNGFFGIYMDGQNAVIENNTISRTVQFHPNCVPSEHPGADADGIVIYGSGHRIVGNTITDIGEPNDPNNVNPHSDCIQSSKISSNTVLKNSTIANNYFKVNHNSGKGIIIESKNSYCENMEIYNNIFEIKDIGICMSNGKYRNISVCNNVFKTNLEQASWGTAIFMKNVENYKFINNITIDCRNEHRKIIGGSGEISHNLAYNSDNSNFSMTPPKQENEIVGENPNFVKYTGLHGNNDYHLQSNSPAIDKGKTLEFIKFDKENTERPQGNNYDIGCYEN